MSPTTTLRNVRSVSAVTLSSRPSLLAGIAGSRASQAPSAPAVASAVAPPNSTVTRWPAGAVPQTGTGDSRCRIMSSLKKEGISRAQAPSARPAVRLRNSRLIVRGLL